MAEVTGVKVVEVCSVAPSETTNCSTPTSLSLTFFDVLWLRSPPVERVFFYQLPNTTTISFSHTILPNLKHSLSLTLQHFLPLAGTITWPQESPHPIINYVPGNAVSFTVAESTVDFNMLCSDTCQASLRHPLIPHLPTSDEQASVMALQVTLFPGSGFSIGITTHHAAMDGKASTLFLKAWAYVCSNILTESSFSSLPKHLAPFYDRSMIKDTTGMGAMYLKSWLNMGGPNNRSMKVWDLGGVNAMSAESVRGSFELTSSNIRQLKQHAKSKLNEDAHVTTFSVACAYALQCLVKAEEPKTEGVAFLFSVDCRSRLETPLPSTYFGNCIIGHKVMGGTKKLLGDEGFVNGVEGMNEALKKLEDGVFGEAVNLSTMMKIARDNRIFTTAGSPRFEVYSIDFGWGRPLKVDMTSIGKTGAFCVSESRDENGGVEISLVLNKQEMEAFGSHFNQGLQSL
ncbi:phenolic glucoside malonyltransferase 1-like [Vigna unguiculata]|uniref:Shikimate O-hydroxycinnamoyltransferase n=1 Tax=Vigna unguiculata TaxID=3917 RepID=A0A4D6LXU5_VIGUN|nr:phenolic glucoside malonyltransferase 1-like [Vigna unguiculata]QCD92704.1 shikimate O-hydroxycinnamoyltransferase [Vigna unguiculata]